MGFPEEDGRRFEVDDDDATTAAGDVTADDADGPALPRDAAVVAAVVTVADADADADGDADAAAATSAGAPAVAAGLVLAGWAWRLSHAI